MNDAPEWYTPQLASKEEHVSAILKLSYIMQ